MVTGRHEQKKKNTGRSVKIEISPFSSTKGKNQRSNIAVMSDAFYHSVLKEAVMPKKTSFVAPNLKHVVLEAVMPTKNSH
jgi:hypothetical protein